MASLTGLDRQGIPHVSAVHSVGILLRSSYAIIILDFRVTVAVHYGKMALIGHHLNENEVEQRRTCLSAGYDAHCPGQATLVAPPRRPNTCSPVWNRVTKVVRPCCLVRIDSRLLPNPICVRTCYSFRRVTDKFSNSA